MTGLRYGVLTVAWIVVLSAVGSVPSEAAHRSIALYLALVVGALVASVMVRELRRDLDQLVTYWCAFGFIVTAGSVMVIASHRIVGSLLTVGTLTSWIASIVGFMRARLAKDIFESPLLQRFAREQVFERAGVQLALEVPDERQVATGSFDLRVFVQNCWDAPRQATITFRVRHGFAELPGGAHVALGPPLALEPGEIGVLSVPVLVQSDDRVRLYANLTTAGAGGRRRWRGRAQTIPLRISPIATILIAIASLSTMFTWGGGLRITIPSGTRRSSGDPPPQRWHRLAE